MRLLYEATRDAGFWNMHWNVTDQPPNSDRIWRQWRAVDKPSIYEPTAIAECDELSALFAFLVERPGVRSVGLFWPYSNHTVAVWVVQPTGGQVIRVVVPTSQIFLEESDDFDTGKFNPWKQKTIYEYTRRDVADSFEIPKPLADSLPKANRQIWRGVGCDASETAVSARCCTRADVDTRTSRQRCAEAARSAGGGREGGRCCVPKLRR